MNPQLQIKKLRQKIANSKKSQNLTHLWLELIFWQLIQKKEITLPNYLPKIEQTWTHLKQIKTKTKKWPRKKLKQFLTKQNKVLSRLTNLINQLRIQPPISKIRLLTKKTRN